ncbi:MAG: RNA 2'-phosphotransferase, partial [Gemmatimonadota bacterium]|nr:RNA 2'-phosphotransferase [Gemmatimonadota bacterium]
MAPRIVHISKLLSLMLRHRPDEFGLQVDRYGFADLDEVLRAFQDRNSTFTLEDIEKVVYDGEKQRFEIVE